MEELRKLIIEYGDRSSTAFIYVIFVTVSLVAAVILYGILHSTGFVKVVLPNAVEGTELGGAAAGFLVILILLIHYYNQTSRNTTITIKGNVLDSTGNPVKNASVFVEGAKGAWDTDDTGYFAIEASEQQRWVVRAKYQDMRANATLTRGNVRNSVSLTLASAVPPGVPNIQETMKSLEQGLGTFNKLEDPILSVAQQISESAIGQHHLKIVPGGDKIIAQYLGTVHKVIVPNDLAKLPTDQQRRIMTLEKSMDYHYQRWDEWYPQRNLSAAAAENKQLDLKLKQIAADMEQDINDLLSILQASGIVLDDHYLAIRDIVNQWKHYGPN